MTRRALLLAAGIALAAPAAARESVGVFGSWGAFTDVAPARCLALSAPLQAGGASRWRAFASVATWPDRHIRNQIHLRLSRARADGAPITLSVGERRFDLIGGRGDAAADVWAPDARTDAAIVAAMRSGRSMSVATVAATGQPFADVYALTGAATAIDAAAVACVGR